MNTHAKRAFSALATFAVVVVTVFSIVALIADPVSAGETMTLSGPTTGRVGDKLTYTAHVTTDDPRNPSFLVEFKAQSSLIDTQTARVDTNRESGDAIHSFTFMKAGSYTVSAGVGGIVQISATPIQVTITEATPTPTATTPTPTASGGGSNGGGSSGGADIVSQAQEGIADVASQAEAATGLGSNWLLIGLAVIVIVLLAIIATALLMRR